MRTTVTLDDELLKKAQEYTGIAEKSVLVNAALTALVQREAARRLARMGGTAPGLKAPPRAECFRRGRRAARIAASCAAATNRVAREPPRHAVALPRNRREKYRPSCAAAEYGECAEASGPRASAVRRG